MFAKGDIVIFIKANNPLRLDAVCEVIWGDSRECEVKILECPRDPRLVGDKLNASNDRLQPLIAANKMAKKYLKTK